MRKLLIISSILFLAFTVKGQELNWKKSLGKKIFKYKVFPNKIIVLYGDYNGDKVVRSERLYPDIIALDKFTGEKLWEIKKPIDMIGATEGEKNRGTVSVALRGFKNKNVVRISKMLIIGNDGKILFNPKKEGITNILYSKIFPEGIMASVKYKGENSIIFLSSDTWKITWVKKGDGSKINKKFGTFMINMMSNNASSKKELKRKVSRSPIFRGFQTKDGNYIIHSQKDNEITSFNLKTGKENWKYKAKIAFYGCKIARNKEKGRTVVYMADQVGRFSGKKQLIALDGKTGKVLWRKEKKLAALSSLKIIDDKATIVAMYTRKRLGKKYFQIFDIEGNEKLKDDYLKGFGIAFEAVDYNNGLVTVITRTGQKNHSSYLSYGSLKVSTSKTGSRTKLPELVNIIDVKTGEYLFKKRIKTSDIVQYTKLINNNLLVIQQNKVQVFNTKTNKRVGKDISSKTPILYVEDEKGTLFISSKKSSKVYKVNELGELEVFFNIKKSDSKIKKIHEIILLDSGILLHGLTYKNKIVFVKIENDGKVKYEKIVDTPNYKRSFTLPIIENDIYIYNFDKEGNPSVGIVDLESGNIKNQYTYPFEEKYDDGWYIVSKIDRIIYHIPRIKSRLPFNKKADRYRAKGIFVVKRFAK